MPFSKGTSPSISEQFRTFTIAYLLLYAKAFEEITYDSMTGKHTHQYLCITSINIQNFETVSFIKRSMSSG